jgi:hypothetical protein
MIARPKSMGAIPTTKPLDRLGKAARSAGEMWVTSTFKSWMKITPKMGPIVVPRPPIIIIPT